MDDMTDSCTYPHTQWEDIKDRLPVSTVLQAVWDEPQRVVRLMLPKAGLLSTFDVEYIMWYANMVFLMLMNCLMNWIIGYLSAQMSL